MCYLRWYFNKAFRCATLFPDFSIMPALSSGLSVYFSLRFLSPHLYAFYRCALRNSEVRTVFAQWNNIYGFRGGRRGVSKGENSFGLKATCWRRSLLVVVDPHLRRLLFGTHACCALCRTLCRQQPRHVCECRLRPLQYRYIILLTYGRQLCVRNRMWL